MNSKVPNESHMEALNGLVGTSPAILKIKELIPRIAPTNLPVLIEGERGVGKTLIARIIHQLSDRANKPFVSIDLAALPESLATSELFGHRRGAFTGATSDRIGLIQRADGGTLFLDEIESAPLEIQALLTSFLGSKTISPLGAVRDIPVDVRVIAAANTSLQTSRTFRTDLHARLSVILLKIPSLTSRREDIPQIVEKFLSHAGKDYKITDEALARLMEFPFQGNLRELHSIIERATVLSSSNIITVEDLMLPLSTESRPKRTNDTDQMMTELLSARREIENLRRTTLVANPIWEGRLFSTEPDYCFVLMPFADVKDIQMVYRNHIKPIVEGKCGLRCERADDINDISGVMQSVWESINRARLVIADMTERNPNVFYELGIAHTLGKPVIMITQSMDYVPFDLKHLRCIVYEFKPGKVEKLEEALEKTINRVLTSIPVGPIYGPRTE